MHSAGTRGTRAPCRGVVHTLTRQSHSAILEGSPSRFCGGPLACQGELSRCPGPADGRKPLPSPLLSREFAGTRESGIQASLHDSRTSRRYVARPSRLKNRQLDLGVLAAIDAGKIYCLAACRLNTWYSGCSTRHGVQCHGTERRTRLSWNRLT
ncbi:hypothetical protein L227DRAFT_282803 [Lentinus tigrinus ALCF2SS1-6]|uniref:Uncharacterized protein n=1 Tax=Lentinus tigrinus ALCF2SS1-6 TaxID=1328759 RepID=A0A5C2RYU1_9APHY|nr:hypothetical protein L227DRAFT_282803 [Lentinus tigrinus ALCF2SS1-6]